MDIHRKRIVSRSIADIFNIFILCRHGVIQFRRSNAVNAKTYLFPVQIGLPLANASKSCRIYGYSTHPDYW
jgi:hypothetical protein